MNIPLLAILVAQSHPIWQIGVADGKPLEFGLAPAGHANYREDPFYLVGTSKDRDLPYVLPGPDDQWAGRKPHRADIAFGLESISSDGKYELTVSFAETHSSAPPRLRLVVNGKAVSEWNAPRGLNDDVILGKADSGRTATWRVDIPASILRPGNNTLSLVNDQGSWVVFDALQLAGPEASKTRALASEVTLSLSSTRQAILRTPNGPRQSVDCEIVNIGPAVSSQLTVQGRRQTVHLRPGRQTVELEVPPVKRATHLEASVVAGALKAAGKGTIQPVRPWTIYLFPHSHVDIGYTDLQDVILKMHQRNFFDSLALAKEYSANPTDSKFHFNVEATWVLDRLLQTGTEAQKQAVINGLRNKTLFLSGGYANLLTGVMHPEEMMQSFRYSRLIGEKYGLTFDTVTQTDVPGMTWGNVVALYEAGMRNLHLMPNVADRVGGVHRAWRDRPFWWVSPSGKERLFVWQTDEYSVGAGLGWTGDRSKPLKSNDPMARFIGNFIFPKLEKLARNGYPYDILGEPWSTQDNTPVDADVPAAARMWNERYVYPRLVLSTIKDACEVMKRKYGKSFPEIRGDYTPYWEDGVGSTALETSKNRETPDRLIQAETLSAMDHPGAYSAEKYLEAWRNVILFSEHTWGAWNSISSPDDPWVKGQWEIKGGFARTADQLSRELLDTALGKVSGPIEVRNTSSWSRTDLVRLSPAQSQTGDRVIDADGRPMPSQRLKSGELAVMVRDVPPLGAKRLQVVAGQAFTDATVSVDGLTLSSTEYRVQIDPTSGAIASLTDMRSGKQLADKPLNQYAYLIRTDLKDLQFNDSPKFEVIDSGPLVATIRATSNAPGTRKLVQEVSLVAGLDRIEVANHLDKSKVREKEAVHFCFPFAVTQGKLRVELPWAVIEPEKDQIAGANKNWLTTYGYADVSNDRYGITWSSLDAPLIELGEISARLLGSGSDADEWRSHIAPTQTLYSWALNNHWHTNYKADQEGPLTFRYAMQGHAAYAPDAARRFGASVREPLLVGPATGQTGSLLTLSDPSVVATRVAPTDDGKAIWVRLYGTTPGDKRVRLTVRSDLGAIYASDILQHRGKPLGNVVTVPGLGVLTLRIERK